MLRVVVLVLYWAKSRTVRMKGEYSDVVPHLQKLKTEDGCGQVCGLEKGDHTTVHEQEPGGAPQCRTVRMTDIISPRL